MTGLLIYLLLNVLFWSVSALIEGGSCEGEDGEDGLFRAQVFICKDDWCLQREVIAFEKSLTLLTVLLVRRDTHSLPCGATGGISVFD